MYYAWFGQTVYFQQTLPDGLRVNYPVNIETIIHILLIVIYATLNVKPLKKCMYFWVSSISCPNLTLLYINYMTNGFVPVVPKRILDIMLRVRVSLLRESILVDFLVYFLSLHPYFRSIL